MAGLVDLVHPGPDLAGSNSNDVSGEGGGGRRPERRGAGGVGWRGRLPAVKHAAEIPGGARRRRRPNGAERHRRWRRTPAGGG